MNHDDEFGNIHQPVAFWQVALLFVFPYALIGLFVALSHTDSTAMYSGASLLTFIGQVIGWPLVLLG